MNSLVRTIFAVPVMLWSTVSVANYSYLLSCDYGCIGSSTAFINLADSYQFGDPLRSADLATFTGGDIEDLSYTSSSIYTSPDGLQQFGASFVIGTFSRISGALTSAGLPVENLIVSAGDDSGLLTFRMTSDGTWSASTTWPTSSEFYFANFTHGGHIAAVTPTPIPAVPEPETYLMWLLGMGVVCFAFRSRDRKAIPNQQFPHRWSLCPWGG